MRNQTHFNSGTQYAELVKSERYSLIAKILKVLCLTSEQKTVVDSIVKTGCTDNRVIAFKM